jgi:hypothetical protein
MVLAGERVLRLQKDGTKQMKKDDEKRNVRKMKYSFSGSNKGWGSR